MEAKILLVIIITIWVSIAIYLLVETRKKIKLLGKKHGIFYPFQCMNCKHIKNHSYSAYMEIVKKPRHQFKTFTSAKNQYLFYCDRCKRNAYQEIIAQQIPSNPRFEKERQKLLMIFILNAQ